MMNVERGQVIAEPIGLVKKVESDSLGRCWGGFMRLRVEIKVNEPLMRAVTIYSRRLQTTESYAVQYERLPFYCFSCGLLGHSYLVCENPAERDAYGDLPYTAKRLSVDEIAKKMGGSKSGTNATSTAHSGTSGNGAQIGKGKIPSAVPTHEEEIDFSSPPQKGRGSTRGRGRSSQGRGGGRAGDAGSELFLAKNQKLSTAGRKRKSAKDQKQLTLLLEAPSATVEPLALVAADPGTVVGADKDVTSSDSNKKQRTTPTRSADQAEAAMQPRQTQ
jgi:hypothetical protein